MAKAVIATGEIGSRSLSGSYCGRFLRSADRTAAAADVLDHDRAEQRFDPLRPRTADGVVRPARRERNHQSYRPRWIALRPCDARGGRQGGSTSCQTQKLATKERHAFPLRKPS